MKNIDRKYIILVFIVALAFIIGVKEGFYTPQYNGTLLRLTAAGKEKSSVDFASLNPDSFEATIGNGTGKGNTHTYTGVDLAVLFKSRGLKYTEKSVIVAESESGKMVTFSGADIIDGGKVYVISKIDGNPVESSKEGAPGIMLLFIEDVDTGRNLKNLYRLTVD